MSHSCPDCGGPVYYYPPNIITSAVVMCKSCGKVLEWDGDDIDPEGYERDPVFEAIEQDPDAQF
jgi:endogenous inhibitor of DNA gyrase (YacG/DUF329 family)